MGEIELKPCPFCGGKPIWQYNTGGQANNFAELQRLNCSECYRIDMPYWEMEIDCIKQWNARSPSPHPSGEPARAEAEPVAWRWRAQVGGWFFYDGTSRPTLFHDSPEPLYTTPPSRQTGPTRENIEACLKHIKLEKIEVYQNEEGNNGADVTISGFDEVVAALLALTNPPAPVESAETDKPAA